MGEQFSAVVDLNDLLRALRAFITDDDPAEVRLTIDDRHALTIEPATPATVTIQGKS